jgi:cysteine desulfurase family protein
MEHNAVMRPLRSMERQGVHLSVLPCTQDGQLDATRLSSAIPHGTKLVIMAHVSNVTGTILPIKEMAVATHGAGALLLVDASQSAGVLPIDMKADGIDLLAFTGHKELQGPPGAGGLVIGANIDPALMEPLMRGGTGSRSESEEQPEELPDKYESGTLNLPGIAGLGAGIRWIEEKGIEEIRQHLDKLRQMLVEGLSAIRGIHIYGPDSSQYTTGIVSFTADGKHVSEVGFRLDEEYGILTRVGLHCAPAAHRTIGTFPEGTVRMAPGVFTTENDIYAVVEAVSKAAQG